MVPSEHDRPFLDWARQRGCAYCYTTEAGIPKNSLKLYLGMLTVYIHDGKLVRLRAHSEGRLLDQMMYEFMELFALCGKHDAYLAQCRCLVSR